MTYSFTITSAFGKVTTEEIVLDNPKQIKQIKEFMLSLAPQIAQSSLRMDRDPKQNAEITMRWAMHLSVAYEAFRKIATAHLPQEQDSAQKDQREAPSATPRVRQAQARIPLKESNVSGLPGPKKSSHPSPLSPLWKPPEPHI